MSHTEILHTRPPTSFQQIHPDLIPGILLARQLLATGKLTALADRLRLVRQGGYSGVDLLLFLIVYLAAAPRWGIRPFWSHRARDLHAAALLLGRRQLPSPSAVSRMLASVDVDAVRDLTVEALTDTNGMDQLLEHPATATTDALGQAWHVFDRDGRVLPHRRRHLPDDDGRPHAVRLVDASAAPGYSGRKRADVQVHRSTLLHNGSGAFFHIRLAPGGGHRRSELTADLDALDQVIARTGIDRSRVILRADGEFGKLPSLAAVDDAGLAYVTRLTRPRLLDQPEVRRHLEAGPWHWVPDSGCGPRRSALDLGEVLITPGKSTRKADGTHYAPVRARVVVSRCRLQEHKTAASVGTFKANWQMELFVALRLPPDAWPASAVVELYFGRAGAETRFHLEDRAMGLDRTFSWSLAGRQLAIAVGLMVHNWRLVEGHRLQPPDDAPPPPTKACISVDPRPLKLDPLPPQPLNPDPIEDPDTHPDTPMRPILDAVHWPDVLRKRVEHGWNYDHEAVALRCPTDKRLPITNTGRLPHPRKRWRLQFRAPKGTCTDCPMRADCFTSPQPKATKMVTVTVPASVGEALRPILKQVQLDRRRLRSHRAHQAHRPSDQPPKTETAPFQVTFPNPKAPKPRFEPHAPMLRPEVLRRRWQRCISQVQLKVEARLPRRKPPDPAIARSRADRQRLRSTWKARRQRYALPVNATVHLTIGGSPHLLQQLGFTAKPSASG